MVTTRADPAPTEQRRSGSRALREAVFARPSRRRDAKGWLIAAGNRIVRTIGRRYITELPDLTVVEIVHESSSLPRSLDGIRLLHLSDLHLESLPRPDVLLACLKGIPSDVIVITGDIAEHEVAAHVGAFFGPLFDAVSTPCFAVLGNHDRSELRGSLSGHGVTVLDNRTCRIDFGAGSFWLAGVDDDFAFGAADLECALRDVPGDAWVALLAHSPDLAEEAARRGCALYLCGHTHGGQVALPGVGPLFYRRRYPRDRIAGRWQHLGMSGYTSTGLGSYRNLVRINCPPEVAVHTLRAP